MEPAQNSPSSSNSSPPPTLYSRSDSEVVEKPGFHGMNDFGMGEMEECDLMALLQDSSNDCHSSEVEIRVIESSQAGQCYSPYSQHSNSGSSSKGDIDGSGDEFGGQGDEDEGFVDEFCDTELQEDKEGDANIVPSLQTIDQLLPQDGTTGDMTLPANILFDDFDLGVDVLDTEQTCCPEQLKSPAAHIPSSPYQLVATSSPVPVPTTAADLHSLNQYNDYLNQSHSSGSPCVSSPHSQMSNHSGQNLIQEDEDMAIFHSVCEDMAYSSSYDPSLTTTGYNSSYSTATYSNSENTAVSSSYNNNPTLTSASLVFGDSAHFMDLSEASKLITSGAGGNNAMLMDACFSVPQSVGSTSLMIQAPSTAVTNTHPAGVGYMNTPNNHLATNVMPQGTYMNSRTTETRSRASQTQHHTSNGLMTRQSRSLSPAPLQSRPTYSPASPCYSTNSGACYFPPSPAPHSPTPSYASASPAPSDTQDRLTDEQRKYVDMPFYQFKKILDDPNVGEKHKEELKNIRRRGKNKVAAKHCRQKKMNVLCGLQQEIDQLKDTIGRWTMRSRNLEQMIAKYKGQCSRTTCGPIAHNRKHS